MKTYRFSDQLTVFESALYRTTCSWVRTQGVQLLVDPNWLPQEVAAIHRAVQAESAPLYLLFTHSDYDHIVGYTPFVGAPTVASVAFDQRPDKAKEVDTMQQWDAQHYIDRPYPITYPPVTYAQAGEAAALSLAGLELITWPAAGHNADGLLTYLPQPGILIVGDYLSDLEFPFVYFSIAEYHRTLDRLHHIISHYQPRYLVPGHGSVTTDTREMLDRLTRDRAYLQDLSAGMTTDLTEQWLARFPYPGGLRAEHEHNVDRVRRGTI